MARASSSRSPGRVARHGILILASAGALFPLYLMVANAFKTNAGYLDSPLAPPTSPSTEAIRQAFGHGDFPRWILNSLFVAACSVALSSALAILAAFAIAGMRWRLRSVVENGLIALMVIPPIVMVIPLFRLWVDLKLLYTYQGAVIIYTGLMLPFSIFLLA